MPQVLPMTRVEAYLAYKAGVIQESDLKPTLKTNFYTGLEHWLAYWCGLCADYPVDENNDPKWYNEEEYYVAYLCGIAPDYPVNCYRRVGAYLRHIISYRWPAPEKPLTREEYYLSLIQSTVISNTTPSSDITLNETTTAPFADIQIFGDTFQQTYAGKNLYNFRDTVTVSPRCSADEEGWITCTLDTAPSGNSDNTYYTHNLDLLNSTQYAIVVEVKSISGNGSLAPYTRWAGHQEGQFTTEKIVPFSSLSAGQTYIYTPTTSASFDYDVGLRSYVRFGAGQTGSITFRLSVLADITVTADTFIYEPYVGGVPAPNPDYPQDINVVTGRQVVTVNSDDYEINLGKNLFDKDNATELIGQITANLTFDTTATNARTIVIPCRPNTPYAVSKITKGSRTRVATATGRVDQGSGSFTNYSQNNVGAVDDRTVVYLTSGANDKYLYFTYGQTGDTDFANILPSIQIEVGSLATHLAAYFTPIELCKIGDYQDYLWTDGEKWYKHEVINKGVLDGTGWELASITAQRVRFRIPNTEEFKMPAMPSDQSGVYVMANFAVPISQISSDNGVLGISARNVRTLMVNLPTDTPYQTTEQWVNYLSTNRPPFYSVLADPTDEEITDATLVAQLEALLAGGSCEDTTYITVDSASPNLPALLKVSAYKKQ